MQTTFDHISNEMESNAQCSMMPITQCHDYYLHLYLYVDEYTYFSVVAQYTYISRF